MALPLAALLSLAQLPTPFYGIDIRNPDGSREYRKRPRPDKTPEGLKRLDRAVNKCRDRGVRNLRNDLNTMLGKDRELNRLVARR